MDREELAKLRWIAVYCVIQELVIRRKLDFTDYPFRGTYVHVEQTHLNLIIKWKKVQISI